MEASPVGRDILRTDDSFASESQERYQPPLFVELGSLSMLSATDILLSVGGGG